MGDHRISRFHVKNWHAVTILGRDLMEEKISVPVLCHGSIRLDFSLADIGWTNFSEIIRVSADWSRLPVHDEKLSGS